MGELASVNRRKTELGNIWKLMKLQFFVQRYYYLVAAGITFFFTLSNIYQIGFRRTPVDIDETVSVMGSNIFSFLLVILIFAGNNFLGNERISMYPGTVRSRVAARFCVDYLLLFAMVIWEFFLYLLGGGVLKLIAEGDKNINTTFLFSWDCIIVVVLERFFVSIVLYSLCMLVYGVISRLGVKWSVVLFVSGVLGLYIVFPFIGEQLFRGLEFFIGYDMPFGSYLFRLFVLWGVSFLATWGIAFTVKQWKRSSTYVMWLFFLAGIIFIPILKFRAHASNVVYITNEPKEETQRIEEMLNFQVPGLYKDSVIEKSENLQNNMELLEDFLCNGVESEKGIESLWFAYSEVITVEDAKVQGYVEEDFSLPENKMVMRVTASDKKWNEKYLYEGLVQSLEIVKQKEKINGVNDYNIVFPAALRNDYQRFSIDGLEAYELSGINQLSAILIVDDELYKQYKQREEIQEE